MNKYITASSTPSFIEALVNFPTTSEVLFQREIEIINFTTTYHNYNASGARDAAGAGLLTPIMLVYPPTQEPSFKCLTVTMYLIFCFTAGICGNFSRLALQFYSGKLRIGQSDCSPNCTQVTTAILYVVYFCISLSLPSVIIEHLVQIWMFGMPTCASHFVLSIIGRSAAAWLTVFLFLDQIVTNCSRKRSAGELRRIFTRCLVWVCFLSAVSAIPSLTNIQLREEVLHKVSGHEVTIHIRTFKCLTELPPGLPTLYANLFSFLLDYAVPLGLCVGMSWNVGAHVRRNRMGVVVFQSRLQRLRVVIATLYFGAYAPHWIAVWSFVFSEQLGLKLPAWYVQWIGDAALLLPYTLPAVVWLPLSMLSVSAFTQARFYENVIRQPCRHNFYGCTACSQPLLTADDGAEGSPFRLQNRRRAATAPNTVMKRRSIDGGEELKPISTFRRPHLLPSKGSGRGARSKCIRKSATSMAIDCTKVKY
ncbi:Protein NPR-26 [Aphelenchoides avenae]|nr:Protein NPR-26 [Aphelenchus avenae]